MAYANLGSDTTSEVTLTTLGNPPGMNGRTGRIRFIFPAVPVINYTLWKIPQKILLLPKHPRGLKSRALKLCYTEPVPNVSRTILERIA